MLLLLKLLNNVWSIGNVKGQKASSKPMYWVYCHLVRSVVSNCAHA